MVWKIGMEEEHLRLGRMLSQALLPFHLTRIPEATLLELTLELSWSLNSVFSFISLPSAPPVFLISLSLPLFKEPTGLEAECIWEPHLRGCKSMWWCPWLVIPVCRRGSSCLQETPCDRTALANSSLLPVGRWLFMPSKCLLHSGGNSGYGVALLSSRSSPDKDFPKGNLFKLFPGTSQTRRRV